MAFGESTMSRTQVQLWYSREDVNDDARPGGPSTLTDETLQEKVKMILDNRRITIRRLLKTTSHGHRSEGVDDDVQRWSRFAQKCHNWWRIIGV